MCSQNRRWGPFVDGSFLGFKLNSILLVVYPISCKVNLFIFHIGCGNDFILGLNGLAIVILRESLVNA